MPGYRAGMVSRADRWRVDYDRVQHQVYAQGRRLAPGVIRQWVDAVAGHAPDGTALVADVGAGTGRFSPALAEGLQASVVAIEPSVKMLQQAVAESVPARVSHVAGRAEQLPLVGGVFDVVFLSMVAHHLQDLDRVASEIARTTRPEAIVVFRNVFRGRMADIPLFRYFPSALDIEDARAPAVDDIVEAFAVHGFEMEVLEAVPQETDPSMAAYYERLSRRALSVFEFLTDDEIAHGLRRLHDDAQAADGNAPVHEPIDLLILHRYGG